MLPAGPSTGDSVTPSHRRSAAGGYELVQLAQHALVNRRIANHARAPVGFGLAGFELRLD